MAHVVEGSVLEPEEIPLVRDVLIDPPGRSRHAIDANGLRAHEEPHASHGCGRGLLIAAATPASAINILPSAVDTITTTGVVGVLRAGSPWEGGALLGPQSSIVDGAFLTELLQWNIGSWWWDEDPSVNASPVVTTIHLNQLYTIDGFTMQADNNDVYRLEYWTGTTWQLAWDGAGRMLLWTDDPRLRGADAILDRRAATDGHRGRQLLFGVGRSKPRARPSCPSPRPCFCSVPVSRRSARGAGRSDGRRRPARRRPFVAELQHLIDQAGHQAHGRGPAFSFSPVHARRLGSSTRGSTGPLLLEVRAHAWLSGTHAGRGRAGMLPAGGGMTWIKTIPLAEADDSLRQAMEVQRSLYPPSTPPRCTRPPTAPPASWPRTR